MSPKFNTTSQKTVVITTIRDRMKATQFVFIFHMLVMRKRGEVRVFYSEEVSPSAVNGVNKLSVGGAVL